MKNILVVLLALSFLSACSGTKNVSNAERYKDLDVEVEKPALYQDTYYDQYDVIAEYDLAQVGIFYKKLESTNVYKVRLVSNQSFNRYYTTRAQLEFYEDRPVHLLGFSFRCDYDYMTEMGYGDSGRSSVFVSDCERRRNLWYGAIRWEIGDTYADLGFDYDTPVRGGNVKGSRIRYALQTKYFLNYDFKNKSEGSSYRAPANRSVTNGERNHFTDLTNARNRMIRDIDLTLKGADVDGVGSDRKKISSKKTGNN
ncbi:hypothetical protein AB2B38_009005 [Balneola sp. MJW-20]|uniref:hypothetical protein n=1 Tax=Gracilimonas aurantiaca TaxID=3234185 RepID=UPI00346667C6